MNYLEVVNRSAHPLPWAEGDNIPWNDPAFSERMLMEHLSQEHDAASRRFEIIDRHVAWIRQTVLHGFTTHILDLGCGPGLYSSRLAQAGHVCVGIDFSPASIRYASEHAQFAGLNCRYTCQDVRTAEFGSGYGLAMMIFGEFNVFRPTDARLILQKAYAALDPGGVLLLEPSTFDHVKAMGQEKPEWYTRQHGLFSDTPYLCLEDHYWDEHARVSTMRYFIVDAATAQVTRYASSQQAYTEEDLAVLLRDCGFSGVVFYPSLMGVGDSAQQMFMAVTARK